MFHKNAMFFLSMHLHCPSLCFFLHLGMAIYRNSTVYVPLSNKKTKVPGDLGAMPRLIRFVCDISQPFGGKLFGTSLQNRGVSNAVSHRLIFLGDDD